MTIENRRSREKHNRKIEILRAALDLFSEKGFAAVSMDQIAEKADLTKPTLYQYFKNKAELFSSIVLDLGFDFVEQGVSQALSVSQNPEVQIKNLKDLFKELCLGKPRKVFLLYLAIGSPEVASEISPELIKKMKLRLQQTLSMIEEVFERGVAVGAFKKINASEAVLTLWSMCVGFAKMKESGFLMGTQKSNAEDVFDSAVRSFLKGIQA